MEFVESLASKIFINGEFVQPVKGLKFTTFNPNTGKPLIEVAQSTEEDIELAIAAGRACLNSDKWGKNSTGAERAVILRKLGELFTEWKDRIAKIDSLDNGKPYREAAADVDDAIGACGHFADLAIKQDSDQNEIIDCGDKDFKVTIQHDPIGVVAAITPWNYPFLMAIWKVVPAIAAGCATVLKPSELSPLSCLILAKLCHEAGLPAGALNVVNGEGPVTGAAMSSNPKFDKISFTGSVPTARKIMMAASMGPRAVSLELGGKSPMIIFDDVSDIDAAVDWTCTGIFWGSGQVCSATSRVYVHESIKETFMEKLIAKIKGIKIMNTQSDEAAADVDGSKMGPVVSKIQYDKIWGYIDEAVEAGIEVAYGADRSLVASMGDGYFIPPTVFVDPPEDAKVYREEIFGPVLCIKFFSTEDDAIRMANDTCYGLAAAVISDDDEKNARCVKKLEAGIVWVNNCQPAFIQAPWGGVKQSGIGRELGRWGLEEFTAVKQVCACAPGFKWGIW